MWTKCSLTSHITKLFSEKETLIMPINLFFEMNENRVFEYTLALLRYRHKCKTFQPPAQKYERNEWKRNRRRISVEKKKKECGKNSLDDAMEYNRTNEINDSYISYSYIGGVIHLREYTHPHFYCTRCGGNRDRKLMIERRIMLCSEDRFYVHNKQ